MGHGFGAGNVLLLHFIINIFYCEGKNSYVDSFGFFGIFAQIDSRIRVENQAVDLLGEKKLATYANFSITLLAITLLVIRSNGFGERAK